MPIIIDPTPNPNALKFSVGVPVGGPQTYAEGRTDGNQLAEELLAIQGVVSMFMTADFVTLTKDASADWNAIAPLAKTILESHFE